MPLSAWGKSQDCVDMGEHFLEDRLAVGFVHVGKLVDEETVAQCRKPRLDDGPFRVHAGNDEGLRSPKNSSICWSSGAALK
jgi:hypothetical protein